MGGAAAPSGSPVVLGVDLVLRHRILAIGVLVALLIDGVHSRHELLLSSAVLCPLPTTEYILDDAMGIAVNAGPGRFSYIPTRRSKKIDVAMGSAILPAKDITSYLEGVTTLASLLGVLRDLLLSVMAVVRSSVTFLACATTYMWVDEFACV